MPTYDTRARLVLVMHKNETVKPTATGPIALAILKNSQRFVQGVKDAPLNLEHLQNEERRVLVLFPSDDARILTKELITEDPRPVTLVVPDGNWRQATRIPIRVPGLQKPERVVLNPGRPTQWGVRRETRENGLATFEAIARAFGVLENEELQKAMEDFFVQVAKATIAARGYKDNTN